MILDTVKAHQYLIESGRESISEDELAELINNDISLDPKYWQDRKEQTSFFNIPPKKRSKREYCKKHYREHKTHYQELRKKYYLEHKEEFHARYEKNKENIKEYQKQNRERINAYYRNYRRKLKEKKLKLCQNLEN